MAKTNKKITSFDIAEFYKPIGKEFKKGGKMIANEGLKLETLNRTREDVAIGQKFKIDTDLANVPQYLDPNFKGGLKSPAPTPYDKYAEYGLLGLTAIDALIPGDNINKHHVVRPGMSYNPQMYGQGSQAIMKKGGKMKYPDGGKIIKTGIGSANDVIQSRSLEADRTLGGAAAVSPLGQQYLLQNHLDQVLLNRQKLNPVQLQQVQAQKGYFNKDGDFFPNQNLVGSRFTPEEMQVVNPTRQSNPVASRTFKKGGTIEPISNNPYDGGTQQAFGASHEEGGIDMSYGGQRAEVEGGEPMSKDSQGNLNIFGDLTVPGTNKKFKTVAKELAREENKITKLVERTKKLSEGKDENDPFDKLALNSANIMLEGSSKKLANLAKSKEVLAAIQDSMLQHENIMKHGGKIYAESGAKMNFIDPDQLDQLKKAIWLAEGKAKNDTKTKLGGTAYGKYQFIKDTRQKYYSQNKKLFKEQFNINSVEDFEKAFLANTGNIQEEVMNQHIESLDKKYKGNINHILAAHRLGEGAADSLIKTGKATITKQDGTKRTIGWDDPIMASISGEKETMNDYIKRSGLKEFDNYDEGDSSQKASSEPSSIEKSKVETPLHEYDPVTGEVKQVDRNPYAGRKGAQSTDFSGNIKVPTDKALDSAANYNRLNVAQYVPELVSLATNRQEAVPLQQYTPELYSPYQVSFEDRLNANNSTLRSVTQKLGFDPAALSEMAAQAYSANSSVLAEEFRTNQGIQNDITNKNVSLLNDAEFKNLGLADQQMVRQSQAKSNTKSQLNTTLNSITSKVMQNKLENIRLITNEAMFDFRYNRDAKGRINGITRDKNAEDATLNFGGGGTPSNNSLSPLVVDPSATVTQLYDNLNRIKSTSVKTPSLTERTGLSKSLLYQSSLFRK